MSYDSQADLGGRLEYGPVVLEDEDKLFHAPWEREALALTLAMGATGAWNIDMSRSARETLPDYASLTYYEIWIRALEKLLIQHHLVEPDEIEAARVLHPAGRVSRILRAAEVPAALAKGSPTQRSPAAPARFAQGEPVRTRAGEVAHHTRLPGYARGKTGRIERVHGTHVFADTNAQGIGEQPQWLYTVVFTGRELWGTDAPSKLSVSIDAWEPYLEPAP